MIRKGISAQAFMATLSTAGRVAPPNSPEPPCWHERIREDGICRDCGKKAAIQIEALSSRALYSYPCPTALCDGCSTPSMALTARHDKWLCPGCRARVPAHPKEMDAREKLAAKIAQRMFDCEFTPDDFAQLSESMWASFGITFKADKKTISPECRVMIAEMLNRLAEIAGVERA